MLLNAIGVYAEDGASEGSMLKRVKSAQRDKSVLFESNQLATVDALLVTSPLYCTIQFDKIYVLEKNTECIYLYRSMVTKSVLAIVSKTPLDKIEQSYLFKNIEHILIRPGAIKRNFDDMIAQTICFTGRDVLMGQIQDQLADIKTIMLDNIDKVIQRGESLEDLKDKSVQLKIDAVKFGHGVGKLNSSCCW